MDLLYEPFQPLQMLSIQAIGIIKMQGFVINKQTKFCHFLFIRCPFFKIRKPGTVLIARDDI
jgi:hypothetical protein